jgi:hypothetical protein
LPDTDGSWTRKSITTEFIYNALGELVAASGFGIGLANDGFDNYTASDIIQEYQIILGQAKVTTTINRSFSSSLFERGSFENPIVGLDGTWNRTEIRSTAVYDGMGHLQFMLGSGVGLAFDGFNYTASVIEQTYDQELLRRTGLQKVLSTYTRSFTSNGSGEGRFEEPLRNPDGSWSRQENWVDNIYNADGILQSTSGRGTFFSDDGFGNRTTGTNLITYEIFEGEASVLQTITDSQTINLDGSTSSQHLEVTNDYDDQTHRLLSATGTGSSLSNDGFGNFNRSLIDQTYAVVRGQARVTRVVTRSFTSNAAGEGSFNDIVNGGSSVTNQDGSFTYQTSEVTNEYNSGGRLISAEGRSASLSNDGYGNWTASGRLDLTDGPNLGQILEVGTFQTYTIIQGQARLFQSRSQTYSSNAQMGGSFASPVPGRDRSWSRQEVVVTYEYNNLGVLIGATGNGLGLSNDGSREDGTGNFQAIRISQEYSVVSGQAKLLRNISESYSSNASRKYVDNLYERIT